MLRMYTDGSCINNGKKVGSKGGIGVAYPELPAESYGAPLPADIHGVVGPRRMPFRSLHMQVATHCANTSRDVRHRQLKWACNLTLTCHLTWTCNTLTHLRM